MFLLHPNTDICPNTWKTLVGRFSRKAWNTSKCVLQLTFILCWTNLENFLKNFTLSSSLWVFNNGLPTLSPFWLVGKTTSLSRHLGEQAVGLHSMPCRTPCRLIYPFKILWSLWTSSSGVKCPLVYICIWHSKKNLWHARRTHLVLLVSYKSA